MRQLEELAANAWPALRCALVDGWLVRFAQGHTHRANSVLPLAAGSGDLDERIARCEDLYRRAGQVPMFKLYPGAEPGDLDAHLARRGYAREAEGQVMGLDHLEPAASAPAGWTCSASPSLTPEWFRFHAAGSGLDARRAAAAQAILEAILPDHRFLLLAGAQGPAACALVVLEHGWAGIFDVLVDREWRGRGLGRATLRAAQALAAGAGARRAYLQVQDDNRIAINLYASLGYRPLYPYGFRVRARRD